MSVADMTEQTQQRAQEAERDQTQDVQLDSSVRRRAIEDKVLLLSPTVGRWEGRYKIPPELVHMTIGGEEVDTSKKGITTPYTVMMTDEFPVSPAGRPWKKRFNEVLKIKDRIIRKYSVPFQMGGARIVPKHKGVEFFREMIGLTLGKLRHDLRALENAEEGNSAAAVSLRERIREVLQEDRYATDSTPIFDESREDQSFAYQWKQVADEFCRDLEDNSEAGPDDMRGDTDIPAAWGVFRQIREKLEPREAWEAVQGRMPLSRELMRAKFYASIYPVELASGTNFGGVTASLLQDYQAVVNQALDAAVEGCIENVIEGPRQELVEALAGLEDVVSRNGRVTARSFKPVYEAIEKLRLFGFACTPDMLQQIAEFENRMGNTVPTSLDAVTAANNGFMAALRSVKDEIADADKAAQDLEEFGREYRGIQL